MPKAPFENGGRLFQCGKPTAARNCVPKQDTLKRKFFGPISAHQAGKPPDAGMTAAKEVAKARTSEATEPAADFSARLGKPHNHMILFKTSIDGGRQLFQKLKMLRKFS